MSKLRITHNEALEAAARESGEHGADWGVLRDYITQQASRDWAVRVLDAWVDSNEGFWSNGSAKGKPCCMLHYASGGKTPYQSMTSDAARHAAAEAVFPTLPDAARAELGECP